MTTRADGRGGSTPPRPAAPDSAPGQWFVFRPWVYDVDAAIGLLRAAPRPRSRLRTRPRPVPGPHVRAISGEDRRAGRIGRPIHAAQAPVRARGQFR